MAGMKIAGAFAQAALLASAVLMAGCGGGRDSVPNQAPQGMAASPADWDTLRSELARVLDETGAYKRSAAPPNDARSQVSDLAIVELPGGGTAGADALRFTWGYRSSGDYNQDGQVLASDLSSIGIHFGKRDSDASGWEAAAPADGNGDGIISAQDLTPIGQFYRSRVDGYKLEYSTTDSPDGDWTEVSGAGLPVAQNSGTPPAGGGFLQYSLTLDLPLASGFYRVVPFDATGSGIASLSAEYEPTSIEPKENEAPLAMLRSFMFQANIVGTKRVWDASQSTDDGVGDGVGLEDGFPGAPGPPQIAKYEWDFDGDGEFEYESRQPLPDETPSPESIPGYDAEDNSIPRPEADYYYFEGGAHEVTVRVTDILGLSSTATLSQPVDVNESWHVQTLPVEKTGSGFTSGIPMAEVDGRPMIRYYDDAVKFSYLSGAPDAIGSSWPQGAPIGSSAFPENIVMVDGHPACAWSQNNPPNDNFLLRSLDPQGSQWGEALLLGDATWGYTVRRLIVLNGKPMLLLATSGGFGHHLMYAEDASGTSFNAPFPLDLQLSSYSMFVISGRLAFALYDSGSQDLQYIRATDELGEAWPATPVIVDYDESVGQDAQLVELQGLPAIAYFDRTDETLNFVLGLDPDGQAWNKPSVIDHLQDGYNVRIALLENRPSVLYTRKEPGEIAFAAANDSVGASWSKAVVVDNSAPVAQSSTQNHYCLVTGMPSATYVLDAPLVDGKNFPFRFAQYR